MNSQAPDSSSPLSPADLEARKALGKARLRENRIEDALRIYASILKDYPQDIDACLFIGDCYLAEGENDTALLMYNQALQIDPNHPAIQSRLRLARGAAYQPGQAAGQTLPNQASEVAKLLQRLTGRSTPISEAEVQRAARLLDEMIHQPHPARIVAARLNEIDELLPALLEVNIRQARSDGRPDVAEALENLMQNIQLQLGVLPSAANLPASEEAARPPAATLSAAATPKKEEPRPAYLFLTGQPGSEPCFRQAAAAQSLIELGFPAVVAEYAPKEKLSAFRGVVFRSPHRDPRLLELLAYCSAAHIPSVVDLDQDYEQMPVDHPDYAAAGLGTLERSRAFTTSMLLAGRVSASSAALAASLHSHSAQIQVIAEGWSQKNGLWTKPSPARRTIHIGWVGYPGQLEDVMTIRRVLVRVCREFSQVRLVAGGDPQVYQLFENMPDASRLFLPAVSPEDYPFMFSQVDILVVPLRNNAFNRAISDRRVLEAGVRGIPWVASPTPAFAAWKEGGLIAHSLDEWHTHLRQLVMDQQLRGALGEAGRSQAAGREAGQLGQRWADLFASIAHPTG